MKKVAILTLLNNNYNYGAILQALALQKAVERFGFDAEVIDYVKSPISLYGGKSFKNRLFDKISHIGSFGDICNILAFPFRKQYASRYAKDLELRKAAFNAFIAKHMNVGHHSTAENVSDIASDFDIFITGSDQVWRPYSFDINYFLPFAENKIRFSYAASLGVDNLSLRAQEILIPLIRNLNAISVREKSSMDLLVSLGCENVKNVVDPTLLFDSSFWDEYATIPEDYKNKRYILSYQIGDSGKNRDIAKKIAKSYGCKLIALPGISKLQLYDFQYADKNILSASPSEFLGLIKNAECVVTDSFHACVFSIIFQKDFYALDRYKKKEKDSMNCRIYDLLSLFGLDDRLVLDNKVICKKIKSINYEKYIDMKEASFAFLKENLENVSE